MTDDTRRIVNNYKRRFQELQNEIIRKKAVIRSYTREIVGDVKAQNVFRQEGDDAMVNAMAIRIASLKADLSDEEWETDQLENVQKKEVAIQTRRKEIMKSQRGIFPLASVKKFEDNKKNIPTADAV